jgi:hypothetical protein
MILGVSLDLMQEVIDQIAEREGYKILLWRRKKEIETLDSLAHGNQMWLTWLENQISAGARID